MDYANDQWERIKDFLPDREGHVGALRPTVDGSSRPCFTGSGRGIPWRDLAERFGDWKIVHQRFNRWAKSGVFERIFKVLADNHDNEYMMIDSSIIRA